MHNKPLKECMHPGCHVLTTENRCPNHKRAKYYAPRETSNSRGYNYAWGKIRAVYLKSNPLCEDCLIKEIRTIAALVHHEDGNQHNNDRDNLRALCRECHERTHGRKKSQENTSTQLTKGE
jgi:5-methylcytosine-specific restriction protein A